MRIVRRARRRLRCIRRGHRWQYYEHLHGDMVVAGDRCVRCGRRHDRGVRPIHSVDA